MYAKVNYIVISSSAEQNVSLAKIQSQHHQLNVCFSGLNDTLSLVPQTGKYAFANVIGIPNIAFLPTKSEDLNDILRITCSSSDVFTSVTDMSRFAQSKGYSLKDGELNIYIAKFSPMVGMSFSILGETLINGTSGGNIVGVDYRAVGGPENPGLYGNYALGMTLVHEVGHALGLHHIWNSSAKTPVHSDIPLQKNPNTNFQLTNGDARMDNCMQDCDALRSGSTASKSWLIANRNDCSSVTLYEMGCNFMDYAEDANMAMFSQQQVLNMREVLSTGVSGIRAVAGDGSIVNAKNSVVLQRTVNKSASELMREPPIIGCVVGGVLCAGLGCSWFYFRKPYILYATCILTVVLLSAVAIIVRYSYTKTEAVDTSGSVLNKIPVVGLRLTNVTDNSASFAWMKLPSTILFVVNDEKVVNGHTVTLTDLSPATEYTLRIQARFSQKLPKVLNGVVAVLLGKVTTLKFVTLPIVPFGIRGSEVTTTGFDLFWVKFSPLVTYNVFINDVLYAGKYADNTIRVTGLQSGHTYNVSISAVTSSGESAKGTLSLATI
jgi:hypothetical protein